MWQVTWGIHWTKVCLMAAISGTPTASVANMTAAAARADGQKLMLRSSAKRKPSLSLIIDTLPNDNQPIGYAGL